MPCRLRLPLLAALVVAALPLPILAADPPERVIGTGDRTGLDLTLYQDDNALVHDRRTATLDKGPLRLIWEGVSRQARSSSGILSGPNLTVRAQGFDLDSISGDRMLARAVGHDVTVVWGGDDDHEEQARVLAAGATPLFDVGGKVVAGRPARIVYDQDAAGLRAGPAFTADVVNGAPGRHDLDLAYMTGGLGWQADYIAEILPGSDRVVLSAWATLSDTTGLDFPQAHVAVVAGRPNRSDLRRAVGLAGTGGPTPEPLGPYQMFTLPEPVSLRDGTDTQAVLMPPTSVKVERELVLEPLPPHAWRTRAGEPVRQTPLVLLRLDNSAAAGLGRLLPAGIVRLYQRTSDGTLTYLGEDRMPATPERASARFAIGRASVVTARRSQTDFQHVSADVSEAAYEVTLSNAGDRPVTVTVREAFGGDWLVLEESQPHHRDDALSASWPVRVPAKGEVTLKYRVRVRG